MSICTGTDRARLIGNHADVGLCMPIVIHWPVSFAPQEPGVNMLPGQPGKPEWVIIDPEPRIVDVWKQMIALPKSKVRRVHTQLHFG